ncbi:unnamed protein product [Polarella glacialis]|uniref:ARMC9 CTLH-like domain-containing protein n=1 Tax=Polarella glacialis TaxID=89957 RepID=A0A813FN39_POLGL|nr:unnamed protein product [Polarella glacialis]
MAAGGAPASPAVIPQQSPPEAPDAAGEPSPRDNPSPLAAPASPEEQDAPDEGAESGEAPVVQVGEVSLDVSASAVPVLRDLGFGGWFCELKVVEVVEEYLQFHDLQDSLVTLGHALTDAGLRVLGGKSSDGSEDEGEVPAKSAGVDEVPEAGSEFAPADIPGDDSRTRANLFTCEFAVARAICEFNAGHRDALFEIWKQLVPDTAASSPTGCALELRLRVYFCTLATRKAMARSAAACAAAQAARGASAEAPGDGLAAAGALPPGAIPPESEPDFSDLKAFLSAQTAVAPLDASAESLAPLFALPFVPKPQEKPALRFIFEAAWAHKLRVDLQAFLSVHASVRHVPTLRHLAGAMVMARCPRTAPPPASWHELLRVADLGLAMASQACQTLQQPRRLPGQPPLKQHLQQQQQQQQQHQQQQQQHQQHPQQQNDQSVNQQNDAGARGFWPMPELFAQVQEARRRLVAVVSHPEEAPPAPLLQDMRSSPDPRASPTGISIARGLSRALTVDTEAVMASPTAALLYQDRLWPMSREAALRASSASSLGASYSLNPSARRLHSARSLESRARTATALLPVPPALDFGRIAALIAGEGAKGERSEAKEEAGGNATPSSLGVLRAVLRRLALPDEPIRPRRAFLAAFSCFGALRALAARLGEIVASDDHELTETSLAVMAVCACEVVGRREIEAAEAQKQPGETISALLLVLSREPVSTLVHMHCLAVLQRLSLRWQLQSKMIELGALDRIVQILRPSPQALRAPNLLLRQAASDKFPRR